LEQAEDALRSVQRENGQLKESLLACSKREAAAQDEMLALSQRHKEVFMATERALDNANQAIAARKEQGEDVAVLNQKLRMEMEMRADEQRRCADAIRNLQASQNQMAETFSKERSEFLGHLKASEESVRQLRIFSDQSARSQV